MRFFSYIGIICMLLLCTSFGRRPVTMFMVGDSTMADKTELDISPERGWGQLLPTFLKGNIVVQNHAMNGRSTKSFIAEGRWKEVMKRAHRGDIVVIQFGHNDAKQSDSTRYASIEDYEANLQMMIEQAKAKHLHVILCTPVCRRYFRNGEFYFHHGDYPAAARRVAQKNNVTLIDMEQLTSEWLQGLGDEASKQYYMNVAAGECIKFPDGKTDNTHFRENGAVQVAAMFVRALSECKQPWIKAYLDLNRTNPPKYSIFCRPNFNTDGTVKVESDMKSFKD